MVKPAKTILMCPPTYFTVAYEINKWMKVDNSVNTKKAMHQWLTLHHAYFSLGFKIEYIKPAIELPDMVFTANGGLAIDGKVMLPRFKHKERQGETPKFEAWFRANGYEVRMPENDFEGEGDCLYSGETIFAGWGFRSSPKAAKELAEFFDKKVVSLKLIDPHFYHLDTAFCPLDDKTVMYFPGAFDETSQKAIKQHFTRTIEASVKDAAGFGLNAVSDGSNVVMSSAAKGLISELRKRGYKPVGLDMTEFRKSGGAVKCCTLELRNKVTAKSRQRVAVGSGSRAS